MFRTRWRLRYFQIRPWEKDGPYGREKLPNDLCHMQVRSYCCIKTIAGLNRAAKLFIQQSVQFWAAGICVCVYYMAWLDNANTRCDKNSSSGVLLLDFQRWPEWNECLFIRFFEAHSISGKIRDIWIKNVKLFQEDAYSLKPAVRSSPQKPPAVLLEALRCPSPSKWHVYVGCLYIRIIFSG